MKTLTFTLFFALFAIAWPYYIASRTRGLFTVACWAAPIVGFFFGWLAK